MPFRALLHGLRSLLRPERARERIDDELEHFFEEARLDLEKRGVSAEAARRNVRIAYGDASAARDVALDGGWEHRLRGVADDVTYAGRALWRRPRFSWHFAGALGIAVGVATTVFSVAHGTLLKPLPWGRPDRLVALEDRWGPRGSRLLPWTVTNGFYNAWSESRPQAIDSLGGWRSNFHTLSETHGAERVLMTAITPSVFGVLQRAPAIGRPFVESDAASGAAGVAILSHGFWVERFAADHGVLGRSITLDERAYEVVGVMPREFTFPTAESRLWTAFRPPALRSRDGSYLQIVRMGAIGRLADGRTATDAAAEVDRVLKTLPALGQGTAGSSSPEDAVTVRVAPMLDMILGDAKPALVFFVIASALLVAAAAASAFSLQLSHALSRRQEVAIRSSMGAGRRRLIRQWCMESAMLGGAAAVMGLGVAAGLHHLLPTFLADSFPRAGEIRLDLSMAAIAAAVTLLVSVACGVVPLLLITPRFTRVANHSRLLVVAGQVAAVCTLLVTAALFTRSFVAMTRIDWGYTPSGVLTARVNFQHRAVPPARRIEMLESLQTQLGARPWVHVVGFANGLPFVQRGAPFNQTIPSPQDPSRSQTVFAAWQVISPEYLEILRMRLVAGRRLDSSDNTLSSPVMVVNEAFAQAYLDPKPVGTKLPLRIGNQTMWEVVGVVGDTRHSASDGVEPELFVSYRQAPTSIAFEPMLMMRTNDDPASHAAEVRTAIGTSAEVVPDSVMTMDERLTAALAAPRTYVVLVAASGLVGLGIAVAGLFAILSYTIEQRGHELGIRAALGATPRALLWLVVRPVIAATVAGTALGAGSAYVFNRTLAAVLYGVSTQDLASFVMAFVAVAMAVAAASLVPARRLIRIDPWRVLSRSR